MKYHLLKRNEKILIGVSGGSDSVALLLILNQLKDKMNLKLAAAHLDHGIRKVSAKEAEFVRGLSKKLQIEFISEKANLKHSRSLEESARKIRYDFFLSAAKKFNCRKIALAHTKDDQAETVLMRLLRGSGLSGLGAIPILRDYKGLKIIRPFMEISKDEILLFLKKHKQQFCFDKTNLNNKFFRNRVRNILLPQLADYNNNIKEILANTADNLAQDYSFLKQQALIEFDNVVIKRSKKSIKIDLKKMNGLHLAMQRMIVRLAIEQLAGSTRRFTYKHWHQIEALIASLPKNSKVDLPKSIFLRKMPNSLLVISRIA